NEFSHSSQLGGDDGRSSGKGLDHDARKVLVALRWKHEKCGLSYQFIDRLVGRALQPLNLRVSCRDVLHRRPQGTVPDDLEWRAVCQLLPRCQEGLYPFFR